MFNECLLCLINTRLNFTSNFLDENNPKSNSERMSWSISDSLKLFKKLAVFSNEFLNLIKHSCLFFKQYLINREKRDEKVSV